MRMDKKMNRHSGDFLNNLQTNGRKSFHATFQTNHLSLFGKYSLLGRSVVVHHDADDLGRGGFPDSMKTGHAGKRMACALIGLENDTS